MRVKEGLGLVLAVVVGCGRRSRPDPAGTSKPATVHSTLSAVSFGAPAKRPSDDVAAAARAGCKYARGAMADITHGPSTRVRDRIPIEHIVVVMQENRSFDSYFGRLAPYQHHRNRIDSPADGAANPSYPVGRPPLDAGGSFAPDAATTRHPWTHAPHRCFFDTPHTWGAAHVQFDNGRNDGFFFASEGHAEEEDGAVPPAALLDGERAMWWYDERDIPFYYELFSTFAFSDAYFSEVIGPTYPNRMYLYGATSFGITENIQPNLGAYPYRGSENRPALLFDELEERGVSWTLYAHGKTRSSVGESAATAILGDLDARFGRSHTRGFMSFLEDARAGTLPKVSFVDGDFLLEGPTGLDEHPPAQIQLGQRWVWEVVNAVTTSPSWGDTALFIAYDENGGIYDHVPPPTACVPDATLPAFHSPFDAQRGGAFDRYGFRVPLVVVSPYAKKGYVSHAIYSHTSITRFIEARFGLPALSARDANADALTDLFDWDAPPFRHPPTFAKPPVDEAEVTWCIDHLSRE